MLTLTAVITLSACGTDTSAKTDGEASATTKADGKTAVVYFSATGNTAKVANTIAASTGGTLFEIKPDQPYTEEDLDYSNSSSRTSQEHADGALRPAYVGDIENWDSYDTIYIGYPIWWGKAPNIVYTFVENHDFQAKKLSPSVPLAVVLSVRVAKNLLKRQKQAIGKKENALAVVSVR